MKKSKWIILFLLVFLAAGCDLFDPARNVYESHILDIIDYLQRMEYEVRVNNIGDDPPESATLWQKDSSIREDNIKLEYSNLSITELTLEIDLVQSWASGTATANGKEFILEEDSIR